MTTTTPTDLASFLLARIAEDEAAANYAHNGGRWESLNRSWDAEPERDIAANGVRLFTVSTMYDEHITRHDPARVLAECAAKRAILDELEDSRQRKDIYNRGHDAGELSTQDDLRFRLDANVRWAAQEAVVRLLVSAYRDHPDYDPDWP